MTMKTDGVNQMTKDKPLSPFDFLNSINFTKLNLIDLDARNVKFYNSFVINRSLSYFPDTVAIANEMNRLHHIDNKLQNDFLINIVRKRKRFSKWDKSSHNEDFESVKEYYGYSDSKTKQIMSLLSPDNIEQIKHKVYKGGRE